MFPFSHHFRQMKVDLVFVSLLMLVAYFLLRLLTVFFLAKRHFFHRSFDIFEGQNNLLSLRRIQRCTERRILMVVNENFIESS